MDWDAAMKGIHKNPMAPVYTLTGTEYTLAKRWLQALRREIVKQTGQPVEMDGFDFDQEGCDNALLACQTVSLFAENSLVFLDQCSFLLANAKSKHDLSGLEKYLEDPIPGRVLLLRVSADKLDERKRIVKQIKKFPLVSCSTPKPDVAVALVEELAREKGIEISREAMQELWRRCESVALCETELEKLVSYTDSRRIERADVEELVTPPLEDNVFTWIDGVVKGNLSQTFRTLAEIQSAGYDGFALLALIAKQLRTMWYARVLGDRGWSHTQIAQHASVHPYTVKIAAEQARLVSPQRIEKMLTTIADAEFWVKSGRWEIGQALDYAVLSSAGLIPKRGGKSTR